LEFFYFVSWASGWGLSVFGLTAEHNIVHEQFSKPPSQLSSQQKLKTENPNSLTQLSVTLQTSSVH